MIVRVTIGFFFLKVKGIEVLKIEFFKMEVTFASGCRVEDENGMAENR